ncbi:hypothetical protein DV711_14725 [Motiliproteus coralliicola]|uniref:Type II secretory pathway component n=1 Tax=Motiliproteus coralliicola TaxID=2283196 RepID=A0A369WA35_9GAMM|nr:hypothetical protein [Motiliproteus coralliicola]RDE18868.1 hypothetical protein DV711_14725 [Motiliproteus coralliicola]
MLLKSSLKRQHRLVPRKAQQGLGLMSAIFVITIMAVVVVGLSSLVVSSKESYGYELMSVRAFLLAESGGQMAISHLLLESASDCSALPSQLPPAELQSCTLQLNCPNVSVDGIDYFTIESTATCGSGLDQAIRKLTLRVQR